MLFKSSIIAALPNVAAAAYAFDPLQHLAGIAPYFEDPVLDPSAPQGCNVTRASMLVRHAAIYANDFDYESYIEPFTDKVQNTSVDWRRAGPLAFLAKWQTPISDEELEDLTTIGKLEAYKLGVDVRLRYPHLKDPKKVWTSTAERTEVSASSFIDGLVMMKNETERVSVREDAARGADSLTPYKGCPKYSSSFGSNQSTVGSIPIQLQTTHTDFPRNTATFTPNPSSSVSPRKPPASTSPPATSSACSSSAATKPSSTAPRTSARSTCSPQTTG
jgi:acid phosphatase